MGFPHKRRGSFEHDELTVTRDPPPGVQGGVDGAAHRSGRVRLGDALHAVNGLRLPTATTTQQFVALLTAVGRPVFIAFKHATEQARAGRCAALSPVA